MANLIFKIMKFLLVLTTLLLHYIGFSQFDIPKKPTFQTSIYDYADLLNESEEKSLENKLVTYSDSTTTQIVIITVESLKGDDIGILTPRWAQEWGIGQADTDNGILILLSKNDRKIWISPGYGLEHKLTAGINGELIRNVILPEFKAGSYYNGLDKGTTAIFDVIKGTYKGERKGNKSKGSGLPIFIFILFFIILIILISKNKNNRGNNGGSGRTGGVDLMDIIILSSLGRGNGGGSFGGGSSGGGFGGGGFGGGFGGGGFSGGGAGGSW